MEREIEAARQRQREREAEKLEANLKLIADGHELEDEVERQIQHRDRSKAAARKKLHLEWTEMVYQPLQKVVVDVVNQGVRKRKKQIFDFFHDFFCRGSALCNYDVKSLTSTFSIQQAPESCPGRVAAPATTHTFFSKSPGVLHCASPFFYPRLSSFLFLPPPPFFSRHHSKSRSVGVVPKILDPLKVQEAKAARERRVLEFANRGRGGVDKKLAAEFGAQSVSEGNYLTALRDLDADSQPAGVTGLRRSSVGMRSKSRGQDTFRPSSVGGQTGAAGSTLSRAASKRLGMTKSKTEQDLWGGDAPPAVTKSYATAQAIGRVTLPTKWWATGKIDHISSFHTKHVNVGCL